jgi:hypothetical protein
MNRNFMRIISFLLRKRNCKELHIETAAQETWPTTSRDDNDTTPSLSTDSMLHLSYPFYLLSRAPR